MEGRATRLRRWWVFNLFNIYMSYLGSTPVLSIRNCLWPEPASLKDPRQCLSYQSLFCGWPCRPMRYLKRLSSGSCGDRKSCFSMPELGGLLYLLLFTLYSWRANLRYFKRQKCQFYLVGEIHTIAKQTFDLKWCLSFTWNNCNELMENWQFWCITTNNVHRCFFFVTLWCMTS